VSRLLRPTRHIIGHFGDETIGQLNKNQESVTYGGFLLAQNFMQYLYVPTTST